MAPRTVLFVLAILAGALFAQGASEYCASEKASGESCYQQCCESLGYTYDGGCLVGDADESYVSSACSYCTDSYMECVADYESGGSSGYTSSGGGGCCSGFIVLSLLGFAVYIQRV